MHPIRPLIRTGLVRAGFLQASLLSLLLSGAALAGGERVNINNADAATLDRVLDGVGPSKAEAIIAYRKANGAFRSADQLASVKGIGLATVERNRDRIVVAGGAVPGAPLAAKAGAGKPGVAAAGSRPAPKPLARAAAGSR